MSETDASEETNLLSSSLSTKICFPDSNLMYLSARAVEMLFGSMLNGGRGNQTQKPNTPKPEKNPSIFWSICEHLL